MSEQIFFSASLHIRILRFLSPSALLALRLSLLPVTSADRNVPRVPIVRQIGLWIYKLALLVYKREVEIRNSREGLVNSHPFYLTWYHRESTTQGAFPRWPTT